ncbi:hypothetical protein [Streptomyces hydrogenans]
MRGTNAARGYAGLDALHGFLVHSHLTGTTLASVVPVEHWH